MCTECKAEKENPQYVGEIYTKKQRPTCESPKLEKEREIPAAINILEHKIENLERAISMLGEKLSPVLNMKCAVEKEKTIIDLIPTSAMGEKLVSLSNYVSNLHSRVVELRDGLEV